jgi:hypothetical protein
MVTNIESTQCDIPEDTNLQNDCSLFEHLKHRVFYLPADAQELL